MAKSKKPAGTRKSARRADDYRVKKPRLPKPEYMDCARSTRPRCVVRMPRSWRSNWSRTGTTWMSCSATRGSTVIIRGLRDHRDLTDDEQEALLEAATRFGVEPVLVKQIVAKEPTITLGGVVY